MILGSPLARFLLARCPGDAERDSSSDSRIEAAPTPQSRITDKGRSLRRIGASRQAMAAIANWLFLTAPHPPIAFSLWGPYNRAPQTRSALDYSSRRTLMRQRPSHGFDPFLEAKSKASISPRGCQSSPPYCGAHNRRHNGLFHLELRSSLGFCSCDHQFRGAVINHITRQR